jgi:hypothetical protein
MKPLRMVMRLNATTCVVFGALFLLFPHAVAGFVGAAPAWLVAVIGAGLILNGGHLAFASSREKVLPMEVLYFSAGDLLWVTVTLLLVGAGVWITTAYGIIAAVTVAIGVGSLGLSQVAWLSRSGVSHPLSMPAETEAHLPQRLSTARAIALSWVSMKTWVKLWLIVVNAVFLGALAFWPSQFATLTLAAYVASGPWLAAIAIAQRGLTRLLGLAHLIPWVPLLVVMIGQGFAAGGAEAAASGAYLYSMIVLGCVVVCLLLDAADVWRWHKGERYRLGSSAAHRVGASKLAQA